MEYGRGGGGVLCVCVCCQQCLLLLFHELVVPCMLWNVVCNGMLPPGGNLCGADGGGGNGGGNNGGGGNGGGEGTGGGAGGGTGGGAGGGIGNGGYGVDGLDCEFCVCLERTE